MKHILVIAEPQGGQQFAFPEALKLAKHTIADIHVVIFCFESHCERLYQSREDDSFIDVKGLVIASAENNWLKYMESQSVEVEVTYEVVWAKQISKWIIEHCDNSTYDLIVKTGNRSESFFYTSTDWQLFRESSVPVYCISKVHFKPKKVVLVALDLNAKHTDKQKLNENLLEAAFQLSVQTDAVMHCCYAIEVPTLIKDLDLIDVPARAHQIELEVRGKAKNLLELYDIEDEQLHIKQGKSWKVINQLAHELKAQCIVVGSMGRKGIEGKLIGNTAEKVIHESKTDLLVI